MDDDRPQTQIKISSGEHILVDARTIRSCSEVAYMLPESATVWDLSGILIEGQPARREIVIEWLNQVYLALLGTPYEQQTDRPELTTAAELFEFLAFADSIASAPGIYRASLNDSKLQQLRILVTAAGPDAFGLMMDGRDYHFTSDIGNSSTVTLTGPTFERAPMPQQTEAVVRAQILDELEKLLYIGHRLKLKPLLQRLHQFIAASLGTATCPYRRALLPHDKLAEIYSPRVMEAGYTEEAGKQAWIQSQLQQQQCILNGPNALFVPLDTVEGSSLTAIARLERDWNGWKAGEEVNIVLDWTYFAEHGLMQVYTRDDNGQARDIACIPAMVCVTPDGA